MTPELTVLALAALLQAFQIGLAGYAKTNDAEPGWNVGPRDMPPELSARTGRIDRATNNHFEGLILFTIAVVVVTMGGASSALTAACAWIYLAARIAYVPAYVLGLAPWRSAIWAAGFLATMLMILAALF